MSARYFMEQSVPELEDLQRKGLFEPKEITMIMRRRTDFEHRIQGRGSQPRDYMRYADFEANLDKLRVKRSERLGKSGKADVKPSISDWAGFRRIVFIYDRAVRKYPGEMDLWKKYIAFVKEKDAVKVVYRVYGKLLSLQPRNTDAWISAAKYEFEENANARGARELYMRGLRFNADQERLWLSYAQFELAYVAKLLARRRVLGLTTEKQQQDDMALQQKEYADRVANTAVGRDGVEENDDIIALDEEEEEEDAEARAKADADMNVLGNPELNPVLRGDIALALFDLCVAEMVAGVAPDMVEAVAARTCRRFMAVFDQFDGLNREHLHLHVVRYMQDAFPGSADAVFLDVALPLRNVRVSDSALAECLQLSVNKYLAYRHKGLAKDQSALSKRYVEFLTATYLDASEAVSDKTRALLKAIIQKCK